MQPCPTRTTLREFLAHRLPMEQDEAIAAHLRECSLCDARVHGIRPDILGVVSKQWLRPASPADDADLDHLKQQLYRLADSKGHSDTPAPAETVDASTEEWTSPLKAKPRRLGVKLAAIALFLAFMGALVWAITMGTAPR